MLEHIRFLRIPYLRAENFGIFILNDTPYPCRNTFPAASFPLDQEFEQVFMTQQTFSKRNLPNAIAQPLQLIPIVLLPFVESPNHIYSSSIGCPLTKNPSTLCLMQSEVEIPGSHFRQRLSAVTGQVLLFVYHVLVPSFYCLLIGGQPRVILYQIQRLHDFLRLVSHKDRRKNSHINKKSVANAQA